MYQVYLAVEANARRNNANFNMILLGTFRLMDS
jgi:hypothetical protein